MFHVFLLHVVPMLYVDKSMVMTPVLVLLAILEALQTVDLNVFLMLSVPVTKLVFSRNVLIHASEYVVTMPDVQQSTIMPSVLVHLVILETLSLDALLFQM